MADLAEGTPPCYTSILAVQTKAGRHAAVLNKENALPSEFSEFTKHRSCADYEACLCSQDSAAAHCAGPQRLAAQRCNAVGPCQRDPGCTACAHRCAAVLKIMRQQSEVMYFCEPVHGTSNV